MKTLLTFLLALFLSFGTCFATVTEHDVQVIKSIVGDYVTASFCHAQTTVYFNFLHSYIDPKPKGDQALLWNLAIRTWREEVLKQSQIPPDKATCDFFISVLGHE